jgi:hypothetical protein
LFLTLGYLERLGFTQRRFKDWGGNICLPRTRTHRNKGVLYAITWRLPADTTYEFGGDQIFKGDSKFFCAKM